MKRLLFVLLAASAGYGAYRYAVVDAPGRAFHAFARAWAMEDTPAAVAWTSGEAAKSAAKDRVKY